MDYATAPDLIARLDPDGRVPTFTVPRTVNGVSAVSPHKPGGIVVIDPDEPDRRVLDLSRLTPTLVRQVVTRTGEAPASDLDAHRTYGFEAMATIVDLTSASGPKTAGASSHPGDAVPEPTRPTNSKEVIFELEGFGQHTAFYHDVVVSGDCIVLVFATAPTPKYFPTPGSESSPRQMAMRVAGEDVIYAVYVPGIQFAFGGYEFCVLLVSQRVTVTEETGGEVRDH